MTVFRITHAHYSDNPLSGEGASQYGGRWNSEGTRMAYTADSKALACLEMAVHSSLNLLKADYYVHTIALSDKSVLDLDMALLDNEDWKAPKNLGLTQAIGDSFVREENAMALRVPNAIVEGDFNVLINPRHSDFKKIEIVSTVPFNIDERLLR